MTDDATDRRTPPVTALPAARRAAPRPGDEAGIVIVWMALTLFVLMIFAGLMVDLGAWYQQSQDIQRTADAAALAGATYLPANPGPANGNTPANCGSSVAVIESSAATNAYCAVLKE